MSNAKTFLDAECTACSPSSSPQLTASMSGATRTPSDSATHCSTSKSNAEETNSGVSSPPQTASKAPEALSSIVAASDYIARVNNLIEQIAPARDQPAVLRLLETCTKALGAESAAFISSVRDDADVSACRFMLACAPAWCRRYLEENLITRDPWLAYAAHHGEPIVASLLHSVDVEAQRAVDVASQNGFASAVLVPVHSGVGHSRISLLCLGSSQAGYFEGDGFGRFRLGARLLAAELHDWWIARIRRDLIIKARITSSDLDLLRHEHHGRSSKHIAAALHVSASSINSRFQRMNTKLGVPNRRLAAKIAAECGLLD